jgi:DNA polymerase/3'-5' exonuclease PolX
MDMDYKSIIIESLELLVKKEQIARESFKVRAYNKVLSQIKKLDSVHNMDDLQTVSGIGKQIHIKLQEIFETGALKTAEKIKQNSEVRMYDELLKIHGIGIVKAKELIKHSVSEISDLYKPDIFNTLTDSQRIGLKYYKDISQKIPRDIMHLHNDYINKIIKYISKRRNIDLEFQIVGSYRRQLLSSGDIDLLVRIRGESTSQQRSLLLNDILSVMKKLEYCVADLANGSKKYMGIVKLSSDPIHRRMDILITSSSEWPFAILYFTGSMQLNVKMRLLAKDRGLNLNEYGFKQIKKTSSLPDNITSERDIFTFLNLDYLEPYQR